ncbi:hypothetical protein D3C81_970040 [compost metagenome]
MPTRIRKNHDWHGTAAHSQEVIHNIQVLFKDQYLNWPFRYFKRPEHDRDITYHISAPIRCQNQHPDVVPVIQAFKKLFVLFTRPFKLVVPGFKRFLVLGHPVHELLRG